MLNENDIKTELSYAYLHAVAAQADFGCTVAARHKDNSGVDAIVSIREQLDPASELTDFSLDFQLKATAAPLPLIDRSVSYSLDAAHYDKLRGTTYGTPKFLLVFCLPAVKANWLDVSAKRLVCQRCAYWVSLRSAAATDNVSSIAVYLPTENVLTPDALRQIARQVSLGQDLNYHG